MAKIVIKKAYDTIPPPAGLGPCLPLGGKTPYAGNIG
jgi:hypothetical protein